MGRRGERGNGTGMREERENEKYLLSLYKSLHHRNNKKKVFASTIPSSYSLVSNIDSNLFATSAQIIQRSNILKHTTEREMNQANAIHMRNTAQLQIEFCIYVN